MTSDLYSFYIWKKKFKNNFKINKIKKVFKIYRKKKSSIKALI